MEEQDVQKEEFEEAQVLQELSQNLHSFPLIMTIPGSHEATQLEPYK